MGLILAPGPHAAGTKPDLRTEMMHAVPPPAVAGARMGVGVVGGHHVRVGYRLPNQSLTGELEQAPLWVSRGRGQ